MGRDTVVIGALIVGGAVTMTLIGVRAMQPENATPEGRIFLGSPGVYTRERLVNDRNEQSDWLRRELERSDTASFGVQATTRTSLTQQMQVSLGADGGPAADARDAGAYQLPPQTESPAESPIDLFHDREALREEIRAELIENQLDDRHDLRGNTLYRLRFDAALLPRSGNHGYAVIEAQVTALPRDANSIVTDDLYRHWLRQLLADVRATHAKRRDALWAALTEKPADTETTPGTQTLDPAVRESIDGFRSTVVHDPELAKGCELSETQTDATMLANIQCLLDKLVAEDKKPQGSGHTRQWFFKNRFAAYFADRVSSQYKPLAPLVANDGEIDLVADGPGDASANALAEFKSRIMRASTVYVYAVAPKESADRVSAQSLWSSDFGTRVGANIPNASALSASVSARQAMDRSSMGIALTPRVVGFSSVEPGRDGKTAKDGNNGKEEYAHAGWLIGPSFSPPRGARAESNFEQQPAHYVLAMIVCAPSWWTEAHVTTRAYWFEPATGKCFTQDGANIPDCSKPPDGVESDIDLPGDPGPLGEFLVADDKYRDVTEALKEPVIEGMAPADVQSGQPAEIVIPGRNLWRSPLVVLGSQIANRIELLPNMNGLIAHFDKIAAPPDWKGQTYVDETITVWTSQQKSSSKEHAVTVHAPPGTQTQAPATEPQKGT